MFVFRNRVGGLDWAKIESLDVDNIISQSDLGTLQGFVDAVTFSDIRATDVKKGTDEALLNLIRLSQLMLEYLLVGQEQQGGVIEKVHHKYTELKRKCAKLETANVRAREDLAVYQSELLLMHKLHGGQMEAGRGNGALVNTNVKLGSVDQIDGANVETRRVQSPKKIPVASNYTGPASEAKLVGGSAKVAHSLITTTQMPAAGDNDNSSDDSDDELQAEVKAVESEHSLSHAEIDLRLHIARLFEQQRELIIQNVVRKEDAILLNEAAAESSAKQRDVFLKQLSERVDGLTRYMQQAVEAMSLRNPMSSATSAASSAIPKTATSAVAASPFRKKSRGTPNTSVDLAAGASVEPFVVEGGDSLVEAALAHINKLPATSKPSRAAAANDSDILATTASSAEADDDNEGADDEGGYEESVREEQARQRNYSLTRRASALDKREEELASREARVRLMEQALVSSATKVEKQRDELEVSKLKAALFKDSQTPDKKKDASVGTVQQPAPGTNSSAMSTSTSTELEWVLSPSPEKQSRSPAKPAGKEKVALTPEVVSIPKAETDVQKPPPKQPRKLPEGSPSMATSTTSLESLKAQEKEAAGKSAKEAEKQRQRDLGAKIIRTHIKNAKNFVINRGFRKWLDHTVEKREVENYHREFEAERSAEVARALLAQKREKEKQLESQLKAEREEQREKEKLLESQLRAEREELKRKDEEMHSRLAAERAKEKERYDALLAEGEKEKADLLAAKEKEAADEIRRQADALLLRKREEDIREEKTAAEQVARSNAAMKEPKPIPNQNSASAVTDSWLTLNAKPAKPERPAGSPNAKPDKSMKPTLDAAAATEAAKPSKPAKKASLLSNNSDVNVEAAAATPVKNKPAGGEAQTPGADVAFECVFEHGVHVRESPSRNARNIGEIDKGQAVSGTGRVRVEADSGLMYVELTPSPERPQGGWVPVTTKGGKPVVKEITPDPVAKVLRYKCVFEHGAFVRDVPSRNAKNIGEIDEGQIAVATGRVAAEEVENGLTFIEIASSSAFPHGGWVPLTSKAGHTVMEQFVGAPESVGDHGLTAPPPADVAAAVDDQAVDALLEDLEDISDDQDLWEKAQARINSASGSGKGA